MHVCAERRDNRHLDCTSDIAKVSQYGKSHILSNQTVVDVMHSVPLLSITSTSQSYIITKVSTVIL